MGTDPSRSVDVSMQEKNPQNQFFIKKVGRNVFENTPRISVIITAKDSVEHIRATLDSVINQKYREHEVIFVNDGSDETDRLERAIKTQLENIVYIKQRKAGAADARNTGVENARGEIIAFLDCGHIWEPEFLASQFVFMSRNDYDLVYCDASLFGTHSAYRRTFMESLPSDGEPDFEGIIDSRCSVITSGTMTRRQAVIDAGMFSRGTEPWEDYILWLRMAKNGAKIGYQKKQLVKYRAQLDVRFGDDINRLEAERDALECASQTIELNESETACIDRRMECIDANIAVEQGNAFLSSGNFREASLAFRVANGYQKSLKLTAIALVTRVVPQQVLKYCFSNRTRISPFNER